MSSIHPSIHRHCHCLPDSSVILVAREQFQLLNCITVIIRPQKIKVSSVCGCVGVYIIYCTLTIGYVINYDHTMAMVRVVIRVVWWILIILVVVGGGGGRYGGGGSNFVNPTRRTIVRNTTQPNPLSTSFIVTQFFIIIILAPLQSETKCFKNICIWLLYCTYNTRF